jgi:hypothetical protein
VNLRPLIAVVAALPVVLAQPGLAAAAPAASPNGFTDGLVHMFGVPEGNGSQRVGIHIEAGSALPAFGDEETLLVEVTDTIVVATVLDGRPLLTWDSADLHMSCVSEGGTLPTTMLSCAAFPQLSRKPTVIDFSAATGYTQTVAKVGTGDYSIDYEAIDFRGGSGPDYFEGGRADDLIEGNGGDDDLFGNAGDDRISGGPGADTIYGETGADSLYGGPDNDYVSGDEDRDWIFGGTGVDEIDAEDGLEDARVDCENPPMTGAVQFDYKDGIVAPNNYLDVPFNCPVVLTPSAPTEVDAWGDGKNISTTWQAPEFDGNSEALEYQVWFQDPFGRVSPGNWVGIEQSGYTVGPFMDGTWRVWVKSRNEVGISQASATVTLRVGNSAGKPVNVRNDYYIDYRGYVSWGAAPKPGQPDATQSYEVALRVKDKKNQSWGKWTTLPELTQETSMDLSGSLKLFHKRVYQARVRTVDQWWWGSFRSDWVVGPARYAGNLAAPTVTKVSFAKKNGKTNTIVDFTFTGLAWQFNDFDLLSPATLKNGSKWVEGTVTADKSGKNFQAAFGLSGTNVSPNCLLSVEYYHSGGPLSPQILDGKTTTTLRCSR